MAPLSTRRQTFIHYSDPEKTDKLEFCRRAFPLVDGAPGDRWHKSPVWGDTACCPEVELQNEARVEEHLSDPARGTHHRSCGASSERWHRLLWLPEANRKQTVVLFFSSYWKEQWAVKNIPVSQHSHRNYDKLKKTCFSLQSWWVIWVNHCLLIAPEPVVRQSNTLPTFYHTWGK